MIKRWLLGFAAMLVIYAAPYIGKVQATSYHVCQADTACTIHEAFYLDSAPEDIQPAPTFADADIFWVCDAGTEATGVIQAVDVTDEGQMMSIAIAAGDVTNVEECGLTFIDQTATKTYLDKFIIITTYGDAGARINSVPQTGDNFVRLGAPAGASVSADVLVIDNFVDNLETRVPAKLAVAGTAQTAAHTTTVLVLASGQITHTDRFKHFTLEITNGDCADMARRITSSVAAADSVTVEAFDESGTCLIDADFDGATYTLHPPGVAQVLLDKADVNAEADTALSDYDGPTDAEMQARTLVAASYFDPAVDAVATVTTLTGHTAQTGDSFTRLGSPAAASVSADILAVDNFVDDIGVAGAGLTDLGGMSTTMKAQVNTEADTALTDYDSPTNAEFNLRTLASASYFDPTADAVATVTSVTNQVTANITAISGDTDVANYLETIFDLTIKCTVDTTNFTPTNTAFQCDPVDLAGGAITAATGDWQGAGMYAQTGGEIRERRFVSTTTWDAVNSEMKLTTSRAWPNPLANTDVVFIHVR